MITDRAKAIHKQLVESYRASGQVKFMPNVAELATQAMLMDENFEKKISVEFISDLFDIARRKEKLPSIDGIYKAYESDGFYLRRTPIDKHTKVWGKSHGKLTEKQMRELPLG